ncbi:MAG TPA: nucleotidyltransferase family protein [Pyrinomonadaceae bacterium]|nr:nucleotidyltransferase family protein [Pyrinomonadaceae bacterium]
MFGRPEHELLLCVARVRVDARTAARINELLGLPLDWDYLLELARRHAVRPLVYWQLQTTAPHAVPAPYLRKLKENFQSNAARNLFLNGELCRVLRLFEEHGVPAIPYKGPALAVAAYGNLSLRRFVDLDIMTPRRDVLRARDLLISQGYAPQPALSEAQQKILLRTQHNLPLTRDEGRLIIELHWEVATKKFASAMDAEELWKRLETLTLGGVEVKSLSPEDLLLSLCVHGSKHLWERLAWVCDAAELINSHPALDWPRVLGQARRAGIERMLFLGLRLARELLGAALPPEVESEAFDDSSVASLSAQVSAHLFDGADYRPAGLARNVLFNLRARRRWRDKLRYFGFMVSPTDGDLTVLPLPASLSFVYYLMRPFRLLLKRDAGH